MALTNNAIRTNRSVFGDLGSYTAPNPYAHLPSLSQEEAIQVLAKVTLLLHALPEQLSQAQESVLETLTADLEKLHTTVAKELYARKDARANDALRQMKKMREYQYVSTSPFKEEWVEFWEKCRR